MNVQYKFQTSSIRGDTNIRIVLNKWHGICHSNRSITIWFTFSEKPYQRWSVGFFITFPCIAGQNNENTQFPKGIIKFICKNYVILPSLFSYVLLLHVVRRELMCVRLRWRQSWNTSPVLWPTTSWAQRCTINPLTRWRWSVRGRHRQLCSYYRWFSRHAW